MTAAPAGQPIDVHADVVIVGAGPTGLLSAILLAGGGHQVALIERWPAPYPLPRAVGISHETLRSLQAAGVMDLVRPNLLFTSDGSRTRVICTAEGEILSQRRDLATSPSGWPERASFCQPVFERTLNEAVVAHPNVTVLRGWNAVQVVPGDEGDGGLTVEAAPQIAGVNAAQRVQASAMRAHGRYVMGCDGANSIVRTGGLDEFEDLGFAFDWLVVDVIPDQERQFTPELGQILGPPRPTTMVSGGPGRRRWEFMRLDGETMEDLNRSDTAWRLLAPYDVRPENATLERHAVYTFKGRWAKSWNSGRSVLAGDAAHQMPPFLGEGFNSGVRDARAVTWRLDLLLRGLVPPSVLDDYSAERIGHVREVIAQAIEVGRIICVTDPDEAQARNERLREAERMPQAESNRRWRLGEGTWLASDPDGGYLGVQGRVSLEGKDGLFDDLVAPGRFVLLGANRDPGTALPPALRDAWTRIGGVSAHFGPGSPLSDLDGTYADWFSTRGIELALFRPDFYVFGTAPSTEGAQTLVSGLMHALGVETGAVAAGRSSGTADHKDA